MMIRMISGMPSPTSPSSSLYLRSSSIFPRSTTQPPPCPLSTRAPLKMNPSPPSLWLQSSWVSSRRLSRLLRNFLLTLLETQGTLTLGRVEVKEAKGVQEVQEVKETQGREGSSWVSAKNNAAESENQQQTWLPLKFKAPLLIQMQTNICPNWYWDVTYYPVTDLFVSISLLAQLVWATVQSHIVRSVSNLNEFARSPYYWPYLHVDILICMNIKIYGNILKKIFGRSIFRCSCLWTNLI